jgi:hypothetical protein
LVLLDAQRDLGLPLLQLTRFFVVFVLRNSPSMSRSTLQNPSLDGDQQREEDRVLSRFFVA